MILYDLARGNGSNQLIIWLNQQYLAGFTTIIKNKEEHN